MKKSKTIKNIAVADISPTNDSPINIKQIDEELILKKYKKVKGDKESFQESDLIHLYDNFYVEILNTSILLKKKINEVATYRKV
jgi:hypothetical protein